MPKCNLYNEHDSRTNEIKYGAGTPDKCPYEAQYVVHQLNGKDWYLCPMHYRKMKNSGVLSKLIKMGRVEKLF